MSLLYLVFVAGYVGWIWLLCCGFAGWFAGCLLLFIECFDPLLFLVCCCLFGCCCCCRWVTGWFNGVGVCLVVVRSMTGLDAVRRCFGLLVLPYVVICIGLLFNSVEHSL